MKAITLTLEYWAYQPSVAYALLSAVCSLAYTFCIGCENAFTGGERRSHECARHKSNKRFGVQRRLTPMHLPIQDFRYALRTLRKSPGLTFAVILSLAIGIGANTAIFSVTNALLIRPLPYPNPDRLAILWLRSPGINIPQDWPSPGQYIDIKTENHVFDEMAIAIGGTFNLTGLADPERIEGMRTSSSLLKMLGAKPLMGRLLLPEDDTP